MKYLILFLFLITASYNCFSQTAKTIKIMADKYQACLDEGVHMPQCAHDYYLQMDSMLNITYKNLRSKLAPAEKQALKKEQLAWLRKRDYYFSQQEKEFQNNIKSGEWGTDMVMVTYDKDAKFVEERVLALIKQLEALHR